jgi:hypothetical protein
MKITKSQLKEIIKEEISKINEVNKLKNKAKGTDNDYYSDEFYQAEKLLLKGLTSVLGNKVAWGDEFPSEFGDFETYSANFLEDTDTIIVFGEPKNEGEFYIGIVQDYEKWLVKPHKVALQDVNSTAISYAKKYKSMLMSNENTI